MIIGFVVVGMIGGMIGFCGCAILSVRQYEKGYTDGQQVGKWCD